MKKSPRSPQSALSNPKMRSLITRKPPSGISSRSLDTTENSDISEYEIQEGDNPGVRYITESLIQKLSKQENLASVSSLNLSLSKDGGKKFKFIENLEKCERLEVLNLSHNLIQRIEKLERQTRLRELNLADNRIRKIDGVAHMQNLQKLNLSCNEIEHIPAWLGKKMKALRSLIMKQNAISSLQDISRLKALKDLTSLVLANNPVTNLPHYRLYVIFHLRSLSSLDGQVITIQERQEAHNRFNLEEVEKLETDLEKKMKEIEELQTQKTNMASELHSQDQLNKSLQQEVKQQKKIYQELGRQMATRNELGTPNSAWQAELESARSEAHRLQEQDKDNKMLLAQVLQLQDENALLGSQVENLQSQLRDAVDNLVHPEQISARVSELMRKLQTGVGELRCLGPSDVLGQNLLELQRQIGQILRKSEEEKKEAEERHQRLQKEVSALQERAHQAQDYKKACTKAADARHEAAERQHEAAERQLENQVQRLNQKLRTMEEIQGLADQQLLKAEEERERLLAELHQLEAERDVQDSRARHRLSGLDQELRELKRDVASSDKMAAAELSVTKEQLRSLHRTAVQINRERTEEMQEAENYNSQHAALVSAEAEIELLQGLLHTKDNQLQKVDSGLAVSRSQQQEIHRLNDAVQKLQAETDRLRHLLEHSRAGRTPPSAQPLPHHQLSRSPTIRSAAPPPSAQPLPALLWS
ncbi:LOW QUALITY PROTEIN: centriolin-like [Anomaloglossus baeobatrachus]